MFEFERVSPLPPTARYALDDLIIGHFGNPREGLTKWYVGAYILDANQKPQWAWIERQDMPKEGVEPLRDTGPIVPYREGAVEALEVRARRPGIQRAE